MVQESVDLQQMTFENIVAQGEIAHNEQFLIFPQCFHLNSIVIISYIELSHFLRRCFQRHLLQISFMWKRVKNIKAENAKSQ